MQSFPFLSILCLIFIVAKLWGVISWSWLWVLSPIWIPICIAVVIFSYLWIFHRNRF